MRRRCDYDDDGHGMWFSSFVVFGVLGGSEASADPDIRTCFLGTTARTMITERSSSSACACATPVDGCGRDSHCHRRHSRSCSDHDAVDTNDHQNWEWVLNDDVSEANYLNRLIFDRLSVTDLTHHPRLKTPMFLSSTVLRSADYGEECLGVFKDRAGLERESGMDLFVLRNVVMSPFQAAAGFVGKLADIFRETLEECLKVRRALIVEFAWRGCARHLLHCHPSLRMDMNR